MNCCRKVSWESNELEKYHSKAEKLTCVAGGVVSGERRCPGGDQDVLVVAALALHLDRVGDGEDLLAALVLLHVARS